MTDLLEQTSAWLEQQRSKFMTRLVTYKRGEQSVPVLATIGQTQFQVDDGAGALLSVQSRDYLITAAELELNSNVILPQRGDRIIETSGDVSFEYEVLAPGDEPCWRYSDPYRRTLRIHTKAIGTE